MLDDDSFFPFKSQNHLVRMGEKEIKKGKKSSGNFKNIAGDQLTSECFYQENKDIMERSVNLFVYIVCKVLLIIISVLS